MTMKQEMQNEELDFENLEWKRHSHVSFEGFYITTSVAEVGGKIFYRHTKTRRTHGGFGVGPSKTTYSESLYSRDMPFPEIKKIMELAYKKKV